MRYLRVFAVAFFVVSLVFCGWANLRSYSNRNADLPVISGGEELLEVSAKEGRQALLRGLTAQDATDGDLTDEIIIASVSHFLEPGLVSVKYVVFDNHHNAASLTRKVRFTDYESPRFSLASPAIYTSGSSFDLLSRIRAEDCIDGDISDRIRVITNMVNSYSAGVYPVTLEVTNSCGDMAQMTLWVTVLDRENTASIALKEYIVYLKQGASFDPYALVTSVTDQTGAYLSKDQVAIKGSIDTNTPGSYRLTYSYADDRVSGQTAITVVVTGKEA